MSVLQDREKAAAKEIRDAEAARQATKKAREAAGKRRKKDAAVKIARGKILGDTIRDAELTKDERLVIGLILSRRKDRPEDWDVIADFLPVEPSKETPEFVPTRPKIDEPDSVEAA